MTSTSAELMRSNLLEVFGERDGERRAAAIARTYAEDVVFADPEGVVRGHGALDAKVQQLLDAAPGFVFTAVGPLHAHHGLAVQGWAFGPPDAPPVVTGMDVVQVADGRITAMHTFLDG